LTCTLGRYHTAPPRTSTKQNNLTMSNEKRQFSETELTAIIDDIRKIIEKPEESIAHKTTGNDHSSIEKGVKVLFFLRVIETKLLSNYPTRLMDQFAKLVSLYKKKFPKVYEQEIQSAYNETVLETLEDLETGDFKGDSSIKHYFNRILKYKIIDKSKKNTTIKLQGFSDKGEGVFSIDDVLSNLSTGAILKLEQYEDKAFNKVGQKDIYNQALSTIGQRCQRIIRLKYELELSEKEVEKILRIFDDQGSFHRLTIPNCRAQLQEQLLKLGYEP
jgi:DNA-directed RNA polymerase specialized sigma24 family protein